MDKFIDYEEFIKNYNSIAELCRVREKPIYICKDGEVDLVVMDLRSFTKRESKMNLKEQLLEVEEDKILDKNSYKYEELENMINELMGEENNG